jgi:hypothetical protein
MKATDVLRLLLALLLIAPAAACNRRPPRSTGPATAAMSSPSSPQPQPQAGAGSSSVLFNPVGVTITKFSPSIKREAVNKVMSAETETEAQVVALLGEPSHRSEMRYFTNRHGKFEEYDLWWYKAPGQPIVKVTFLNGVKTSVHSGVP